MSVDTCFTALFTQWKLIPFASFNWNLNCCLIKKGKYLKNMACICTNRCCSLQGMISERWILAQCWHKPVHTESLVSLSIVNIWLCDFIFRGVLCGLWGSPIVFLRVLISSLLYDKHIFECKCSVISWLAGSVITFVCHLGFLPVQKIAVLHRWQLTCLLQTETESFIDTIDCPISILDSQQH